MYDNLIIGGIGIRIISCSSGIDIDLPPSYGPFVARKLPGLHSGTLLLTDARRGDLPAVADGAVVATGFNDLGESRLFFDGATYTVGITPRPGEAMRLMSFSRRFRTARLWLIPGDRWNRFILDSMLRIFFSQIAVLEGAFLIHASAVMSERGAHLFMGRSGTGKSTHSSLWLGSFDGYRLLNDDNPLVRQLPDGSVVACGTPWSGKTPCWVNRSAPLLSMTRLRQAPANVYTPRADAAAVITVLPGVSVISHSRKLYERMLATLGAVAGLVRVGELDCLPDAAAALTLRTNVEGDAAV